MTTNRKATTSAHVMTPPWPQSASLRTTMAKFATGVTVITTPGENPHGMTANSFTSVSLDPPLVLCCVGASAHMHGSILSAGSFAVSVLGAEQEELARYFADKSRPGGAAQFDSVGWIPGPVTKAPLLLGALAWVECELTDAHEGGDHSIFVGRVVNAQCVAGEENTLVFYHGIYHQFACARRGEWPAGR